MAQAKKLSSITRYALSGIKSVQMLPSCSNIEILNLQRNFHCSPGKLIAVYQALCSNT